MGRVYKLIYPDAEDDKDTLTSIPVEEMHTYDMKDNPEYKEVVETIHIIDKDPLHRQSQSRGIPKFNFFNDLEQRFIEEYHEHMKKAKGCIGKCRTHKYAKLSEALKVVRIQIDQ